MALACLPFWGETCPVACHEDCLFQATIAARQLLKRITCDGLRHFAWDLDAARFYTYEGPASCTCYNKEKLTKLLVRLFHETPINIGAHHMWAREDDWDAPLPQ